METIAKPTKKQTGIRLTSDTIRELKYLAADTDRNLSDLVEEAVKDLCLKYKAKK